MDVPLMLTAEEEQSNVQNELETPSRLVVGWRRWENG
jgi:hypothetical protein